MEAELEVPIFNLCALIYEIELFKLWIPFCHEGYTVKLIYIISNKFIDKKGEIS